MLETAVGEDMRTELAEDNSIDQAVIICGGEGTRMGTLAQDIPKGLIPLKNGPLLGLIITDLRKQGIKDIYLAVGHKKEQIMQYFGDSVHYLQEPKPLGTGGWLSLLHHYKFYKPFVIVNGDDLLKFNLQEMYRFHNQKNAVITIAAKLKENSSEYGRIDSDKNHLITAFKEKEANAGPGLINTGYYIFDPLVIDIWRGKIPLSLEKQVFPNTLSTKRVFAFTHVGEWHDVGTPERLREAYGWTV
jgi:mannose-1-phosphate guanylyltransferase